MKGKGRGSHKQFVVNVLGRLAQLVRAFPLHGKGRGFESYNAQVFIYFIKGDLDYPDFP